MTLDNFRTLIRMYVPSAKIRVISNTLLDVLINKGVDDVNMEGACWQGNKKFNVVAEENSYVMSSEIDDFIEFDNAGLWWNDGTASALDWKRLDSMSRRTLDDQYPQWKNEDSDSPLRVVLEGDNLLINPTPNTTIDEGFWAFYIKKPVIMSASGHYPFSGSTTEIGSLSKLDDAIIDYVRWKLSTPLGNDQKGVMTEQQYKQSRSEKILLLNRRMDISAYPNSRMRGPNIR